jgi:hypothetical protein
MEYISIALALSARTGGHILILVLDMLILELKA